MLQLSEILSILFTAMTSALMVLSLEEAFDEGVDDALDEGFVEALDEVSDEALEEAEFAWPLGLLRSMVSLALVTAPVTLTC